MGSCTSSCISCISCTSKKNNEKSKSKEIFVEIDKPIKQINIHKVPFYSFNGIVDYCEVCKCYDGDTIWIYRTINNKLYRIRCRLLGIDTAEMKSQNDEEKEFAINTRLYLVSLIYNKKVWIKFYDNDKYGRALCELFLTEKDMVNNNSVNQLLIDKGYAQSYDGGTKKPFEQWDI